MSKYQELIDGRSKDFGSNGPEASKVLKEFMELDNFDSEMTIQDAERRARVKASWEKVIDAVKEIASVANGSDSKLVAKALFIGLAKEHRTLQAQVFSGIFGMFKIYKDTGYDLRNFSAVVASIKAAQFADDEGIYFPLI